MVSVVLKGIITPDGHLEVDLPSDLLPGPVEIEIRQPEVHGVSLQEILDSGLVGMWAERHDLDDSVEFARNLRRRASRRSEE
jgi:hypothetical protein